MNEPQIKLPIWFWIVSVLALVWNLLGVAAYIADVNQTPEALAQLSQAQQNLNATRPAWAVAAFATAVFAGAIGGLMLLLRRKLAGLLFIISLLAVLLQNYYFFVVAKVQEFMAGNVYTMPMMVIIVAIILVWFARSSASKGWIR